MYRFLIVSLSFVFILSSCTASIDPLPTPSPPTLTASSSPPASPFPSSTPTITSTQEAATPLTATVWTQDPYVSVMTYHQFAANHAKRSTALKVRFEDFEYQLNQLYDAGFSLISLEDWMAGKMVVPEGRRPLILSMDDLYFNNQLRLGEDGQPQPDTGFGILWEFYQEHPDFGFSCALFVNLGNKLYADPSKDTWEMELAEAIVWGIDHDLIPYNHFYTHPQLDKTEPGAILWEAEMNDTYLRKLITMAGREDLIPGLENIVALTYGVWPIGNGVNTMLSYINPEGEPVKGVMDIDPITLDEHLPPMYAPDYDPMRMMRHTASPSSIDYLVEHAEDYPKAQVCDLGMVPDRLLTDSDGFGEFVLKSAEENNCDEGVYVVDGFVFRVAGGSVEVLVP